MVHTPLDANAGRTAFSGTDMAGVLFQMAQISKGLPWFLPRSYAHDDQPYLNNSESPSYDYATDIFNFANDNLTMSVSGGNAVSFTYKFQDFRGTAAVFSGWEGLLETRCQDFLINSQNRSMPAAGLNGSKYPLGAKTKYRWVLPVPDNRITRDTPFQICESRAGNHVCFLCA